MQDLMPSQHFYHYFRASVPQLWLRGAGGGWAIVPLCHPARVAFGTGPAVREKGEAAHLIPSLTGACDSAAPGAGRCSQQKILFFSPFP